MSRPRTSRGVSGGTTPTMRPRYITAMRSARATTSSSSGADDQDRRARVPLGDHLLVDELDRADVEAPRRLGGDEQAQRATHLAGQDHLLLVAARERARRARRCSGCARRTAATQLGRLVRDDVLAHRDAARERRSVVRVEDEVLRDGETARSARRARGPRARSRRRRAAPAWSTARRARRPSRPARPGHWSSRPEQRLDELGLPVALHAGDGEDLARRGRGSDTSSTSARPTVVGDA